MNQRRRCRACGKWFTRKKCNRSTQKFCGHPCRISVCLRTKYGSDHPNWKGDLAKNDAKRTRAQRRYQLTDCERCGKRGTERHHKDENPGNNEPSNIQILCRRCHMTIDGRLEKLMSIVHPIKPPKSCRVCGRLFKPMRRGRCSTCDYYFRYHGHDKLIEVKK